jgi:small conductance mechanosensitive channel
MRPERARSLPPITPLDDITTWLRGSGLEIVLVVLGAVLLVRLANWVRDVLTSRLDATREPDALVRSEASKHRYALAQILAWTATVVIWTIAAAMFLTRLGVPFATVLAPLAAVGVALGLGAQRLVQDLLSGSFIIAERQFGYGDLIRISGTPMTDGASGTVEDLTLRVTRLRTEGGERVTIANGEIRQVANLSSDWARATVDVPLPAEVDIVAADELLRQVAADAFHDERLRPLLLDPPAVLGVESLDVGRVNLRILARTQPGKQFQVARLLRIRVAHALRREGIVASMDARPRPGDPD